MGECFSKVRQLAKKPIENSEDLFILKPRPPFSTISVSQTPSNQNDCENCLFEKAYNNSYEQTVETLLSHLFSIFNRRCPHCKKQIKPCARTQRQIRAIFLTLQEKVMLMKSNGASSVIPHSKLAQFATVRKSLHEKQFVSQELQSPMSMSSFFQKPDNVATEIIFKSQQPLNFPDRRCDSVENFYSNRTDYDHTLQPVKHINVSANENLNILKCLLIEDTGIPLCLSQKCNAEVWG